MLSAHPTIESDPRARSLRHVKRMEVEHTTGAGSSYEQAILHATKQHSDRLRALEDGAAQSNSHLDFLEQQGACMLCI